MLSSGPTLDHRPPDRLPGVASRSGAGGPVQPAHSVSASASSIVIAERSYRLVVESGDGLTFVESRGGVVYTSFPLVALAGWTDLPDGVSVALSRTPTGLVATATTGNHLLLDRATVTTTPTFFTVSFQAALGPDRGQHPRFFFDGSRGVDLRLIRQRLSPDPRGSLLSPIPATQVAQGTSFSPPPFDIQLESHPGWMGLGLVQVPNATQLTILPNGSVAVNYPLAILATFRDTGAGGLVAGTAGVPMLGLPSFVFSFSSGPWTGLTAYHSALKVLGYAPQAAPPGSWPAWWSWPLVDTWGQQVVDGASRTSPRYTTAWARSYVAGWRSKYGLRRITLVLDAQWQEQIGRATPSDGFGGVSGLRKLIAAFHREGIHVLLWWPLWILGSRCTAGGGASTEGCSALPLALPWHHRRLIDITAGSFPAQLRSEITTMLGRGPQDLGADGLKIDWGQLTPDPNLVRFAHPGLGLGAAALLRYLTLIYSDAQAVHRGALIDSSAVAPQFGGTTDMLRLYDATGEATWEIRAQIIAAVDPGTLIDGDDWPVQSSQAVTHAITSSVYGTPASYFLSRWFDQVPITPKQAHLLGAIMRLAAQKGEGQAVPLARDEWGYRVKGQLRARTLGRETALAIYAPTNCGNAGRVTVVSATDQWLVIPGGVNHSRAVHLRPGVVVGIRTAPVACVAQLPPTFPTSDS